MHTYISLLQWTQDGISQVKDSPSRLDAAKKFFQENGASIKQTYLVMGQYDLVVISEAPSDEVIAKIMLSVASKGKIRTETFRAFPEEEYRKLIDSI